MKMLRVTDEAHAKLHNTRGETSLGQKASQLIMEGPQTDEEIIMSLSLCLEKHFKEIKKEWRRTFNLE